MEVINCRATLKGIVENKFEFSHIVCGEKFYRGKVSVQRDSGVMDSIPVIISNRIVSNIEELENGMNISIDGEIRTYNVHKEHKNTLQVFVFAQKVEFFDTLYYQNEIYIDGYICKEPKYRTTPLGREICDFIVAVNRSRRISDYIPCICWGRNAKYVSELKTGNRIVAIGRIQSRKYKKMIGEETVEKETYEVSFSSISEVEND